MRIIKYLIGIVLFVAPTLRAQTTTVNATIVDPNGNAYALGTVSAQTVVPLGQLVASTTPVNLNSAGTFSIALPSPKTYLFTICGSPVTLGPRANPTPTQVCFVSPPIAISGGSVDVTSAVGTPAILGPAINSIAGNAATATALQNTPAQCGAGNLATGITVTGAANCTPPLALGITGNAQCNIGGGLLGSCPDVTDVASVVSTGNASLVTQALTANGNSKLCGPNPGVDITCYGARAVNPNIAPATDGVTASITSGTPTATLNGASSFINGDGVVIREAGPTNTLATPGAPTVQSVLMAGSLGTPETANANAGGTTYSYQIVARTQLGGLTAAGTAGTTVTGLPTLGIITATVANSSLSGTTVTVNTSAATDLVARAIVWVPQSGNVPGALIYKVGTTPSNTQFTFSQQGLDSLGSGPFIGAGSINYIVCNHLTWTAVPNAYQYYIYLSGTLIDRTRPGENFYDDCGATIRGTPNIPTYVPTSAPGAATNDPLVTTIVSGAGTTTLTLAANASNTVAAKTIRIDAAPGMRAAYLASGLGTPIYIPISSLGNFFVANSFLDWSSLGSGTNVQQSGALLLNETVQLNRATYWEGTRGGGSFNNNNAFAWDQYRSVTTKSAYPGVYVMNGNSNTFVGVSFNNTDDNALDLLMDVGFNAQFNRCYFNTGKSGGGFIDYLGIGAMFRGVTNVTFDHTTLNTGMANNLAMGPWAGAITFRSDLALANPSNDIHLKDIFTAAKNVVDDHNINFSDMHGEVEGFYTQGARTPLVTLISRSSIPGEWAIKGAACDTTGVPIFTNLSETQFLTLSLANTSGASPGCQAVSGNVINTLTISAGSVNPPFFAGLASYNFTATNLGNPRGHTFSDRTVTTFGVGAFKHAIGTIPAPPVIVVQAGGSLSVGTHTYQYHYYDIDGNAGPLSAVVNGVTTPGNQQVQITVGTPPLGMIGYYVYRDGGRLQFGSPWFCAPLISQGLTLIDPNGVNCGNSPFVSGGAGDAGVRSGNVFSPSYTFIDPNDTGFLAATSAPIPLTANRTLGIPDQTGSLVLTSNRQSAYDNFNRGTLGANWSTFCANNLTISANQAVASAGSNYNCSTWVGNVFAFNPTKDQFAQATITGFNGTNGLIGPGVRNFGYDCIETTATLQIRKNFSSSTLTSVGITGAVGDIIRLEVAGNNLTCTRYVGGVLTNTLSATDSGFPNGFPGLVIQSFNPTLTSAADNWSGGPLNPLAHLDLEQDHVQPQHFIQGITVGPSNGQVLNSTLGNTGKIQQASTFVSGNIVKYDPNGNTIDSNIVAATHGSGSQLMTNGTVAGAAGTSVCLDGGQALTTSGCGSLSNTAYLTSNYTNATTTMSNVTGLSFAVAANTKYKVRCDLDYQTSATTADIQTQWTGPASPTFVTADMVTEVTGSSLSASVVTAFSTPMTEAGTPTITTNFPLTLTMTLSNGANAGTIQLQAAATGVGTVTIIPGSCSLQP